MAGASGPPQVQPERRPAGGHRKRRHARRMAVDILYQADVTERAPADVLRQWTEAGRDVPEYTEALVRGVQDERDAIDELLGEASEEWPVHRMAVVDRTILRLACYEVRHGLPAAVAIDEAVDAANELSTEASGRFINGLLGRIAKRIAGGDAG